MTDTRQPTSKDAHAIPAFSGSTAEVFETLDGLDWAFAEADTGSGGHDVHPYPAKFPPQLPGQLIEHLSTVGHVVLDPFGGSGTTALVALDKGRSARTLDANPVAVILARAKANGLHASDQALLHGLADQVAELTLMCDATECPKTNSAPRIPNMEKWFSPYSVHELCHLRSLINHLKGPARDAAELAVGQTAARVSFQDSETRYVSVPRPVRSGEALTVFARQLRKIVKRLPPTSECARDVAVHYGDARSRAAFPFESSSVNLVVTSPPYPNAYDYHLYHRFRILWTMADPGDLRRVEIGSHLRQQSLKDPIADYERDMAAVLDNMFDLLVPGGWCVLVVGDGKYKGDVYPTSEALSSVAGRTGFHVAGVIHRELPVARRSVTSAGRRLKTEQLLVLRKPEVVDVQPPQWAMCDYEHTLADRELAVLTASPGDASRFRALTFARTVTVGGESQPTQQWLLEQTDKGKRKNSTYATHGIHRYKGKFYPQLGRCLINLSSRPGELVVDPFSGSGTVALEASLLGREFHGIELSPVGAATARAKAVAMQAGPGVLEEATAHLVNALSEPGREILWAEFDESTHAELESWFPPRVLTRLSHVLAAVRSSGTSMESDDVAVQLGHVCVSDVIREVSHQDPSDLRIRRRAEPLSNADVEAMFMTRWNGAVAKIRSAQAVLAAAPSFGVIVSGDSTSAENWPVNADGSPRTIDALVTSPPYAAALPYLDTDRLSIAAVFGRDKRDRAQLESALVGSREIRTRDLEVWRSKLRDDSLAEPLPTSTISFLQALSDAVQGDAKAGFRRQQTPAVLTRYFVAMSRVLEIAARRLRPGADAWFVLGDSKTTISGHTWQIPTTQEIVSIAKHHGLEVVEQIPITVTRDNMRHARNAITANTLLHFRAA